MPLTMNVKFPINMMEQKLHLAKRLWKRFVETTVQPRFAIPKVGAGVVRAMTHQQSDTSSGNKRQSQERHCSERHNIESPHLAYIARGWCTRETKKQVVEEAWVSPLETKSSREYKSRDSSKTPCSLKKPMQFRPVNDSFSTGMYYSTYHFVDRSLLYEDQVAKQVNKWASRIQVEMKAKEFDPMDPSW